MVDNRRRIQSDDPAVETPDEDINGPRLERFGAKWKPVRVKETRQIKNLEPRFGSIETEKALTPYRYVRSRVAKADPLSDGPVPLFLSDHSDGPDRHDLEDPLGKDQREAIFSRRILKTGALTASVIAIGFALFSLEATRSVIVNAKASISGMQSRRSDTPPTPPASSAPQPARDARLASAGQPSAAGVKTTGSTLDSPTTAPTPTREEIATAFQAALQGQAAIARPPPAPLPARRLDADELAALVKRARGLIAIGDIAPARLLLERAADAQEAGAALLLAQTYDPAVLGKPDARSIMPDPATARGWYEKAAKLGSRDAQRRLDQMQN
jgi:hypothetical protein